LGQSEILFVINRTFCARQLCGWLAASLLSASVPDSAVT